MHSDSAEDPRRPERTRVIAAALTMAAISCLCLLGALRVRELESVERALETDPATLRERRAAPHATRISARLGAADLQAGQDATFELCAAANLAAHEFRDAFDIAVLQLAAKRLLLRVPLDAAHLAHVKGNPRWSCLLLGSGPITETGEYSVEVVWHDPPPGTASAALLDARVLDTRLVLRVLAKPTLTVYDLTIVAALGGVLLGSVLLFAVSRRPETATEHAAPPTGWPWLAPLAALALVYLAMRVPGYSALQTYAKGIGLMALQIALAWFLAKRLGSPTHTLGLGPAKAVLLLGATVVAWPSLVFTARLALRIVPSTGEAPIQTFISWPSGMLVAALLGALLPVGEELFFRGYLFGVLKRFGTWPAAIGCTLVFGALHAEQSWGNWGGLLAIVITGATLTALRALTGSTWIALVGHLAYNLTLSLGSVAAATR
ncbi:MAG: type II CAAX endopeptidase family protein [Polyangiales bacterium]